MLAKVGYVLRILLPNYARARRVDGGRGGFLPVFYVIAFQCWRAVLGYRGTRKQASRSSSLQLALHVVQRCACHPFLPRSLKRRAAEYFVFLIFRVLTSFGCVFVCLNRVIAHVVHDDMSPEVGRWDEEALFGIEPRTG